MSVKTVRRDQSPAVPNNVVGADPILTIFDDILTRMHRRWGAVIVLMGGSVMVSAQMPEAPRLVKAWAALLQARTLIEQSVRAGELGVIHNEEPEINIAVSVLQSETRLTPASRQQDLARTLTAIGQRIGDLHQAADASNVPAVQVELRKLRTSYDQLEGFYDDQTLAPARRLATQFTCAMHPDVRGGPSTRCPKCAMPLDQPVRIALAFYGAPPAHTIRARLKLDARPEVGKELRATLHLDQLTGVPVQPPDLRIVHTRRIHLLVVDASLSDYHHLHPEPTAVPGDYAFRFTPMKPGPYRAWADVRPTATGFQEYAIVDIPASSTSEALRERRVTLTATVDDLRYVLLLDKPTITAGEPTRATLRITDRHGAPFRRLEPIMGTFTHIAAFNEDWRTVLHIHPYTTSPPAPTARGGPDLPVQFYATTPGFYRMFAEVQVHGVSRMIPFGINVAASGSASR